MPSTSLRPRKQKTITTRRSADSIYSKLGFDFNPAQQDPESFKHNFYAHNMGRPDTPQHTRRLLRGLNRHVETQDRIASAKDVGELLNPDFKQAVKGMSRRQQQRRYKRWEKIPVSNFTARMNALKKIHEASIDHVAPRMLSAASEAQQIANKSRLRRKQYVEPVAGRKVEVKTMPKFVGKSGVGAYAVPIGDKPFLSLPRDKSSNAGIGVNTHELLHATDPGRGSEFSKLSKEGSKISKNYVASFKSPPKSFLIKKLYGFASRMADPAEAKRSTENFANRVGRIAGPLLGAYKGLSFRHSGGGKDSSPEQVEKSRTELSKYFGSSSERHAYSGTAGGVGVPALKQLGFSQERAHRAQRKGKFSSIADKRSDKQPDVQHLAFGDEMKKVLDYGNKKAIKRSYRKFHKEVHKGIERSYGARNTTGGTTNKFGQVKLATPIGKLPEELRERISRFLSEASIDHVTPELYRGAAKISRELSKGGGHVRLGRDSVKVKPMKKLNFLERYVANKVGIPQTLARAYTRGKQEYTRDNRLQKKHFNLGGRIESIPGTFAQTAPHITHELLHIKDPGVGGSGDTRTHKEYLASRSEQHAYGGASILGVRHLKKMGVPHSLALAGLRAGDAGQAAAYVHATRKKGIPEFIQKTINRKNISIAREFSGLPNQYLAGEAGERPRRKMAKEMNKGIERTYGARNTTGGTTNKFGQVKLARPIGKLPEELAEAVARFRANNVFRGPSAARKKLEANIRRIDVHDPKAGLSRRPTPSYNSSRLPLMDQGSHDFAWKGRSVVASPGAILKSSQSFGGYDHQDIADLAAVALKRKPAAVVGFTEPSTAGHVDHYLTKIVNQGGMVVGRPSDNLYVGKRKNVQKLLRLTHSPDLGARAQQQYGMALGYPRQKVLDFTARSAARFGDSPKLGPRVDVVPLPKPRRVGSLAVPIGKLPEELRERISRFLSEASIDHFTPRLYATARRFERDVRNAKFYDDDKWDLKNYNREVAIKNRRIKGQNPEYIGLVLGGTTGLADTKTDFVGVRDPDYPDLAMSADRLDTIRLNAGHAYRQGVPWQGSTHSHRGVQPVGRRNVVGVLTHELGHATDPAFEFSTKKQGKRAAPSYSTMRVKDAMARYTADEVGANATYYSQASERHPQALEVMYGLHLGKKGGVSKEDALAVLRSGGTPLLANNIAYKHADDKARKRSYADVSAFNNFVSRHLMNNTVFSRRTLPANAGSAERRQHIKELRAVKKAQHKLGKETLKGIERKYGPVRNQFKGMLPEEEDFAAKLQRTKARLKPPGAPTWTSRIGQLQKKLSPLRVSYDDKGNVKDYSRIRLAPHDLAKEVIAQEPNNPHIETWKRLRDAQSDRAMTVRLPQDKINVNKQAVYNRVKSQNLALTPKNMKDAYLGRKQWNAGKND